MKLINDKSKTYPNILKLNHSMFYNCVSITGDFSEQI